jgi:hypothetical protein
MKFHMYRMMLDGKAIGEIVTPSGPREAAEYFLEKCTGFIGAGLRRVIAREPGLLIAEEVPG